METKFTKGKWIEMSVAKGNVISEESKRLIASCNGYTSNVTDETIENYANTKLIIAAPDLLEACMKMTEVCNKYDLTEIVPEYELMVNAINKAIN